MKKQFILLLGAGIMLLASCQKENATSDIQKVSDNVKQKVETNASPEVMASVHQKMIDDAMSIGMKSLPRLKSGGESQYIGVLSASNGTCVGSNSVGYMGSFQYFEDLEDDDPATRWANSSLWTPYGILINGNKNITWTVCVYDASAIRQPFRRMKYGYAIFNLGPSASQFINGSNIVSIHADDEDKNESTKYVDTGNLGFNINNSGLPNRVLPANGNTVFYMHVFSPDPASTYKLPNLGFNYAVFGNFCASCCDQNRLDADQEDRNNKDSWIKLANGSAVWQTGAKGKPIDASANIVTVGGNISYYVQNASGYTY